VTLLQGPSITELSTYILTQIAAKEAPGTADSSQPTDTDGPLMQQQQEEYLLLQLHQQTQQNVTELVQNLLATTQQPSATNMTINQQPVPALDQLTDEQVELLLQQIALGGNQHDAK
jgi:hypothetical protein